MNSTNAIAALGALAHEHRLAAFRLLVQAGPAGLPAGEIATRLGISPASLSFHLKDLQRAELIQPRHEGRQIFYSPRFETVNGLLAYMMENCCGGVSCPPASPPTCSTEGACK